MSQHDPETGRSYTDEFLLHDLQFPMPWPMTEKETLRYFGLLMLTAVVSIGVIVWASAQIIEPSP